jgi:uncharacterized membrane protein YfcA
MLSTKNWLLLTLLGFAAFYLVTLYRSYRGGKPDDRRWPEPIETFIGFITNFFDTLGIGSFATTTSFYKLRRLVSDQVIPGTLNVGHTMPAITQALIYISIIEVEMLTLISMIAAAVAGSWLGAGIVRNWPKRKVQIGMGFALLGAAVIMLMTQLRLLPGGGEALALEGVRMYIGLAGNFLLGVLMTLGIGLYAPCLILVSLLGMSPTAAFPIMMGSCAFLMPVASARFIRGSRYAPRAALGLLLGGVPAVLIAAFIVKSLPLATVRWLVVVVVVYTATAMLRSAYGSLERVPSTVSPVLPVKPESDRSIS